MNYIFWTTPRQLLTVQRNVSLPSLLIPWSRVLLEYITGFQLVKKFLEFYGPRRFITEFTTACHVSISWAGSIQSIHSYPTFWKSILILSPHLHLGLPSGLFPSGFPYQNPEYTCTLSHTCYTPCPPHSSRSDQYSGMSMYTVITVLRVQRHDSLAVFKFTIVWHAESCTVALPFIWTLVIRIDLALRVPENNLPWNCWLPDQVQYSVMASRCSNQAWSKGLDGGTYCK